MNLHVILNHFYTEEGMAIYLISSLKKGKLKINGLALLRHGQYVHKINMRQAFILKMLLQQHSGNGNYKANVKVNNQKNGLLLRNLASKTTYTVETNKSLVR